MIRTWYLRRLLSKADAIIAPSRFLRNRFIEHGVPPSKITFSDYGMRTESLPHNRRQRAVSGRLRCAFIGSVMPHKGVHVLIDAFNRLSNARAELRIYGDPEYAPDYYASLMRRSRNGSVRFMGGVHNNEVYRILGDTDVLIVPSVWYENSPLTMHEAVLAGVPVIASNIGGMAELVKRAENGLLFEAGNADDLYEKIALLIAEPRRLKGLRGRVAAIKGMEENAEELEELYMGLQARDQ
jgi:glycosyltransferase involved in cell wall biosynthesis